MYIERGVERTCWQIECERIWDYTKVYFNNFEIISDLLKLCAKTVQRILIYSSSRFININFVSCLHSYPISIMIYLYGMCVFMHA
jgi:hypothetical protein